MSRVIELVRLLEGVERAGTTLMALAGATPSPEPWKLYPGEEGIFDLVTRYQFYYHSHDDGRDEDGHFHTVRLFDDHTVHLVAISMGRDGWPRGLFTVNYWAIGDTYEPVEAVKGYVRRFRIAEHRGPALLVRFVNLVFEVFRPQIEALQDEKVAALSTHRMLYPTRDPFEDRTLEVPSRVDVDLRRATSGAARAE